MYNQQPDKSALLWAKAIGIAAPCNVTLGPDAKCIYDCVFFEHVQLCCTSLLRYGVMGGKVTRHIVFPEVLDVQPYMSRIPENPQPDDHRYRLYGVLVHEGPSTSSGHYYCYVMTADGSWYCMNDHIVSYDDYFFSF